MAADVIQFVGSIAQAPAVLLDVNDENRWACTVFSTAPPMLRRATSSSMLTDGDLDVATTRGDRLVELRLDLLCSTQDEKATELQRLARIIDAPSALLRYQPVGATHPVFFRTKRGDIAELVNVDVTKATAQLAVTLLADPYVYGLPVTGTATIAHDPSMPNPIGFVLSDVLGDAPAPLRLVAAGSGSPAGFVAASAAAPGLLGQSLLPAQPAAVSAESGWEVSNPTSSSFISGVARRFTRPSSSNPTSVDAVSTLPSNLGGSLIHGNSSAAGDYRLFIRGAASVAGGKIGLKPTLGPNGSRITTTMPVGSRRWLDLGVVRLPNARRQGSPFENFANTDIDLDVRATLPSPGWVDLEAVILIPAGLDVGASTLAQSGPTSSAKSTLTTDDQWAVGDRGVTIPFAGGLPKVYPGSAPTQVRFFAIDEAPGTTRDLAWTYYPRYLGTRPATS